MASSKASSSSSKAGEALRSICRQHVPASKRRELWLSLASIFKDATHEYIYTATKVFGSANPLPSKVYSPNFDMSAAHDRVVCCLAQTLGLKYCPMVPNLAFILLEYLSEAETFAVIRSLYRHGGAGSSAALASGAGAAAAGGSSGIGVKGASAATTGTSLHMFFTSREEEHALALAFLKLVKGRFPRLHGHIERLIAAGHSILDMFLAWFRGFFSGWLPHRDVVRCVDLFLAEGPKSLFRIGLAWLKIRKRQLKKCADGESFEMALRDWPIGGPMAGQDIPYRFDTVITEGFALRNLSKASIFAAMGDQQAEARRLATEARGGGSAPTAGAWHAPLLLNTSSLILKGAALSAGEPAPPPQLALFLPALAPSTGTEAAQMAAGGSTGTGGPTEQQWAAVKAHLARPFLVHSSEQLVAWSKGGGYPPPASPIHPLYLASTGAPQSMLTAPQVAAVMGLLPRAHRPHHCAVLFSTARHSATLETLYRHTAGVAPIMLLAQLAVDIPRGATKAPGISEHTPAGGTLPEQSLTGAASTVYSCTVLVFVEGGLPAPGQGGGQSGTWTGSRNDFVAQLEPEIAHFPAQKHSQLTVMPETGAAGLQHRQAFQLERMVACTQDMLLIGGGAAGTPPALSISADFNTASASALFLEDLCVPVHLLPSAAGSAGLDEVSVRVGAVEAIGFVDGFGGVCTPPEHTNPNAIKLAERAAAAAAAADASYAEAMQD